MSELHFTKTLLRTSEVEGSWDGLSFSHNREIGFGFRFRFVRVVRPVRTGESKLRVRMTNDVLTAGPLGCWDGRVCARVCL